jgi:hypothetical protein
MSTHADRIRLEAPTGKGSRFSLPVRAVQTGETP